MHVAGFKAAFSVLLKPFIGGFAILGFVLVVRCNNSITIVLLYDVYYNE